MNPSDDQERLEALPTGDQVLVVEDELRIRTMLSQALKGMGFVATLAETGEAGWKALEKKRFDILILDLNLPGIDGLSFLERLRRQDQDVQVIILTGFGDLDAAKRAIHLDVVEFLTKPCTLGNLEVALDRARKRRKEKILANLPVQVEPPKKVMEPITPPDIGSGAAMEELERQQILHVLAKHNGNRSSAAKELGISLRKLYYRIGEYQRQGLIEG